MNSFHQILPRAMYNHGAEVNLLLYTRITWGIHITAISTRETDLKNKLKTIPNESSAYTLEKRVRIDLHEFTKK